MMTRKNELLLIKNLEIVRDIAIDRYEIGDEYFLADIELILMELCEYGGYIGFNTAKDKMFCEAELEDFLDFYCDRKHVSSIVEPHEAQYIINLLFDLRIDIL